MLRLLISMHPLSVAILAQATTRTVAFVTERPRWDSLTCARWSGDASLGYLSTAVGDFLALPDDDAWACLPEPDASQSLLLRTCPFLTMPPHNRNRLRALQRLKPVSSSAVAPRPLARAVWVGLILRAAIEEFWRFLNQGCLLGTMH